MAARTNTGFSEGRNLSLLCYTLGVIDCNAALSCSGNYAPIGLDFVLCLIICSVSIWQIARIGSNHLTSALISISENLGLPKDFSGATLLASVTSIPVLFSSVISTFVFISSDTIPIVAGTCIYNLMVCVAISAIWVGPNLSAISLLPFLRDVSYYIVSVVLFLVFLRDDQIVLYECIVLTMLYLGYCLLTWFWRTKTDKVDEETGKIHRNESCATVCTSSSETWTNIETQSEKKRCTDPISWALDKLIPGSDRFWLVALVCTLHLFFLVYLMLDSVNRLATLLQIDSSAVTLIILPIGMNLPSTVGGVIAAKIEKSSDIAISSSFGSNIFSVLVGTGLPWLLRLSVGKPVVLGGVSTSLGFFSVLLSIHITSFCMIIIACSFKLSRICGWLLAAGYAIYMVTVLCLDLLR